MHDLDIIHGRLETVRPSLRFWDIFNAFTSPQTNILVDLDGTARIAGLGSALILDQTTPRSEMSVEWLFRGSAPELMCPQEFGLSFPYNSKPSDIFAFGVLAWEASVFIEFSELLAKMNLARFSQDVPCFPVISTLSLYIQCGKGLGHHVLIVLRSPTRCGR